MANQSVAEQELDWVPKILMDAVSPFMSVEGATILDFGCGQGTKTLGVALAATNANVIGVDVHRGFNNLLRALDNIRPMNELPANLSFRRVEHGASIADSLQADLVYSWSVFEHLDRRLIPAILRDHHSTLAVGGIGFMQVNPLYYSAYGSHLRTVVDEPWAHLRLPLSELRDAVLHGSQVTSHQGLDNVLLGSSPQDQEWRNSIWNTFCGLNRITYPELRHEVEAAGFELLDEVVSKPKLEPPEELLHAYRPEVLTQDGFRIVYRRNE